MIRTARAAFGLGSIAFVFIGGLHSYVHFDALTGDALRLRFEAIGPIDLQGDVVNPWDLFQGVSLLMGFFSIAFGAALLAVLRETARPKAPPAMVSAAAIALLVGIAVVGGLYLSAFQVIGGIAGILCFTLALVARLRTAGTWG